MTRRSRIQIGLGSGYACFGLVNVYQTDTLIPCRFLPILGFSRTGSPRFDSARMKADLDHLDTFYIGGGWSRDGPEGVVQLDYIRLHSASSSPNLSIQSSLRPKIRRGARSIGIEPASLPSISSTTSMKKMSADRAMGPSC